MTKNKSNDRAKCDDCRNLEEAVSRRRKTMTKNKNDKSNDRAECDDCRNEEAVLTVSFLHCDPNEAIGYLDVLEAEFGLETVLGGAFRALADYERLLQLTTSGKHLVS